MKTAITLFLAILLNAASAATYYVRKDGSNSNTGTADNAGGAWLTVQKAATTMVAGDTVYIRAGTYEETATTAAGGTSGNPIRYIGEGDTTNLWGIIFAHSWIEARNMMCKFTTTGGYTINSTVNDGVIDNITFDTSTVSKGLLGMWHYDSPATPARWTINNCRFLNTEYYAVALHGTNHIFTNNYLSSPNGGDGLYLHSSNTLVSGNTWENWSCPVGSLKHTDCIQAFSNNGEIARDNIIEKNLFKDCVGTQVGSWTDDGDEGRIARWTFRNNIWYNVEAQVSITCDHFYFYNNVFYGGISGPLLFRQNGTGDGNSSNCKVFNNAFINCADETAANKGGGYGFVGTNPAPGFEADYNMVIGTGAGTVKTGYQVNGLEVHSLNGVDPLFVNAASADFRLQLGSPLAGAGYNWSTLFTDDFEGTTRTAPWDIGAYKYSGIIPSAPQAGWTRAKARRNLVR